MDQLRRPQVRLFNTGQVSRHYGRPSVGYSYERKNILLLGEDPDVTGINMFVVLVAVWNYDG